MKRSQGFTVIEIIVAILFLATVTTILFVQKGNLAATTRDDQRKVAINAMYYDLEKVYFAKNGSYPTQIDSKTLTAMDPSLFTDPNGIAINQPGSDYRYDATDCTNNACTGYTLRASMEKEGDYVKTNEH